MLYALCTIAAIPAMEQLDPQGGWVERMFEGPVLAALGFELVYLLVSLALMVVWLGWFVVLHDWARGRGVKVPTTLGALAGLFVCGVNLVHPLLTLRRIAAATALRTPLELWWILSWGGFGAAALGSNGSATMMEVVGVLLCWKIALDFRLADQAWNPRAELVARG